MPNNEPSDGGFEGLRQALNTAPDPETYQALWRELQSRLKNSPRVEALLAHQVRTPKAGLRFKLDRSLPFVAGPDIRARIEELIPAVASGQVPTLAEIKVMAHQIRAAYVKGEPPA